MTRAEAGQELVGTSQNKGALGQKRWGPYSVRRGGLSWEDAGHRNCRDWRGVGGDVRSGCGVIQLWLHCSVCSCLSPIPQVSILNKYSEAIRGNLTKIMRLKIVALVTIEIHARDVLEKLYKSGLMDVNAFDWLSQLRFYWEKVSDGLTRRSLIPN